MVGSDLGTQQISSDYEDSRNIFYEQILINESWRNQWPVNNIEHNGHDQAEGLWGKHWEIRRIT